MTRTTYPAHEHPVSAPASAQGRVGVPAGFMADGGRRALPGGRYPGLGAVGALVVPVSLGTRMPQHDEAAVRALFGEGAETSGRGVRALVGVESGGAFRFASRTLPLLIPSHPPTSGTPSDAALVRVAYDALVQHAREVDLSLYDNEGPDGVAASDDDDGIIDLLVVTVETDQPFPHRIVNSGLSVRTGRRSVKIGPIAFLSLPRNAAPDAREATRLVLHSMGLGESECFYPEGYPRTVSALARGRLGWLPLSPAEEEGVYQLPSGQGALVALRDMAPGTGFWLLERNEGSIIATRVVRHGGHWAQTRTERWREGAAEVYLPLTRQFGVQGPRLRLHGDVGEGSFDLILGGSSPATGVLRPIAGRSAAVTRPPVQAATRVQAEGQPLDP